ncbi:H-NS family nucleoid-associated regulatory protein [Trinickia diaoshuihuensis]|uniref:H-NS family nucleoid-associated regulatory protein n=1 Tax=Trinickia diaoshuihuensis TaxID=2292265 RepID=UPI000E21D85F|nr:H-NS family nucleoid-associated regulatory protein [Trinickia diaoshuihuensis]
MATLESIEMKIKRLQEQAEAIRTKQAVASLERIVELMRKSGVTVSDIETYLSGKKRGGRAASNGSISHAPAAVKYRDPKSGATWSGRGRAPAWIAQVKNRNKFLVDGHASGALNGVAGETKRQGDYVRGPQPAKYRHPETGVTWSGRGRAPAWLADAKDRSKFLIEGQA